MTSQRKINSNRANATGSTGPRTEEGKARSSQNALKTGLYASGAVIRGENPVALQLLADQFTAEYHPVTPTERSLVDSLVHFEWLLRRSRWLETEIWTTATNETPYEQKDVSLMGYAFVNQPNIAKVHRLRNSAQRNFNEVLDRLLRLRHIGHETVDPIPLSLPRPVPDRPPVTAAGPDSIPQVIAAETVYSEIGFVPSNGTGAVPAPVQPEPVAPPPDSEIGFVPSNGTGAVPTPVQPEPVAPPPDSEIGFVPSNGTGDVPTPVQPEPATLPPGPEIGFVPPDSPLEPVPEGRDPQEAD